MPSKAAPVGEAAPDEVYAVIEIARGGSVKYEWRDDLGALFVDRLLGTSMHYPCHYGFIPSTLGDDGDPLDVLVVCSESFVPGCVVSVRPIGILTMKDEKGLDEKVLAVPTHDTAPSYDRIRSYKDLPENVLDAIKHFFEHYKDLESGKWVEVDVWQDACAARAVIQRAIGRAAQA